MTGTLEAGIARATRDTVGDALRRAARRFRGRTALLIAIVLVLLLLVAIVLRGLV